jgi:transcription elongation factor Elf1
MTVFETVQCPFCGQRFELAVDLSAGSQSFTTDCEICCRPFEVRLDTGRGGTASVDVRIG